MNKLVTIIIAMLVTNIIAWGQLSGAEIKSFIEKEVLNNRSKSIVVGIIDSASRQVISSGKLSDADSRQPDGNTLYEIASVTKLFTTLLLADYSINQQLNLNDPISVHLPQHVKTPIRNGKEISLLHLATHTSGFPRFPYNYHPNMFKNTYTASEMYDYISHFKPDYDFGSRFKYSNTGMGLIGHILSRKSGEPYEKLIKERISNPLKMYNTTISISKKQNKNLATGHSAYGKPIDYFKEGTVMEASGALYSTVNDLLNFAEVNLGLVKNNLSKAIDTTHIIRGRLGFELGYDDRVAYDYSMGWNIWTKKGKTIYWKDGTSFGFRSFICIDKGSKRGVVILSNSFNDIKDMGLHFIDSSYKLKPYRYEWKLLDTINFTIKTKGVNAAIELYYQIKASKNSDFLFDEMMLDNIANDLAKDKRINDAIKIYELNIKEYPKSTQAFESIAELYRKTGNVKMTIAYYKQLLDLDPRDEHALWIISKLDTKN